MKQVARRKRLRTDLESMKESGSCHVKARKDTDQLHLGMH